MAYNGVRWTKINLLIFYNKNYKQILNKLKAWRRKKVAIIDEMKEAVPKVEDFYFFGNTKSRRWNGTMNVNNIGGWNEMR